MCVKWVKQPTISLSVAVCDIAIADLHIYPIDTGSHGNSGVRWFVLKFMIKM